MHARIFVLMAGEERWLSMVVHGCSWLCVADTKESPKQNRGCMGHDEENEGQQANLQGIVGANVLRSARGTSVSVTRIM